VSRGRCFETKRGVIHHARRHRLRDLFIQLDRYTAGNVYPVRVSPVACGGGVEERRLDLLVMRGLNVPGLPEHGHKVGFW